VLLIFLYDGQQVGHEQTRYDAVPAKNTDHFFLFDGKDGAGANRSSRGHTKRNTCEARLPKEVTGAQDGDNCRLAAFRSDGEHHVAFSDVEQRVGRLTLGVDDLFVSIPRDRSAQDTLEDGLFSTC